MKAYFISDIHLKTQEERNGQILLRFLRSVAEEKPDYLFLLGDIFDMWIGPHAFFAKQFSEIVSQIKKIAKHTRVIYFEGNHDMHIRDFWKNLNVEVYVEPQYFQLGSTSVRCEHGDYINPHDTTYLRYREITKTAPLEWIARMVPGHAWWKLGTYLSSRSRKKSSVRRKTQSEKFRSMIRAYAEHQYDGSKHFNYIITGHMHIRDEYEFYRQDTKVVSINLGSWLEEPGALLLENAEPRWLNLF